MHLLEKLSAKVGLAAVLIFSQSVQAQNSLALVYRESFRWAHRPSIESLKINALRPCFEAYAPPSAKSHPFKIAFLQIGWELFFTDPGFRVMIPIALDDASLSGFLDPFHKEAVYIRETSDGQLVGELLFRSYGDQPQILPGVSSPDQAAYTYFACRK